VSYAIKGALPDSKSKKNTTKEKGNAHANLKPSSKIESGESTTTVVASIIEFLGEGSHEKPVGKEEILEKLIQRFPEKDDASLKSTFGTLVPGRLWETKEIEVVKSPRGYWIHR
jgi:hypothetical protein